MSTADRLLQTGGKVFVVERRLFDGDLRRHFVGEVEVCTEAGFRARGYPFLHHSPVGNFVRKNNPRTRLFSFHDNLIINVLPEDCHIESVSHVHTEDGTILTDDKTFKMDVSEFSFKR
jgi:hypothetical protein